MMQETMQVGGEIGRRRMGTMSAADGRFRHEAG